MPGTHLYLDGEWPILQKIKYKNKVGEALSSANKEKVEFWGEVKNNLRALLLLLCKCVRTSEKKMFTEKRGSSMPSYSKYDK